MLPRPTDLQMNVGSNPSTLPTRKSVSTVGSNGARILMQSNRLREKGDMDGRRKRDVRVSNLSTDFESTSRNMDGVDSDMALEVPDTPDRMTTRLVRGLFNPPRGSSNFGCDVAPNDDPVRRRHVPISRHSSHRNLAGSSNGINDSEFLFREANIARQLSGKTLELGRESNGSVLGREIIELSRKSHVYVSDSLGSRVSRQKNVGSSCESRTPVFEDEKIEKVCRDNYGSKGKGIDLCSDSKARNNISQKVSNIIIGEMSSSCMDISNQDNAKDPCGNLAPLNGQPRRPRSAQRRLVRNGCISPLNIERNRNVVKQKEVEVGNAGSLSNPVHIVSPNSQEKDTLKGKATLEDLVAANDGLSPSSMKDRTAGSDLEGHGCRFEDKGWRTTRNHLSKPSTLLSWETGTGLSGNLYSGPGSHDIAMTNGSSLDALPADPGAHALQNEGNTVVLSESRESRKGNGRINGKRKSGSSTSNVGECSSSNYDDPASSSIGSSRQVLNTRSSRTRRPQRGSPILGPIVELDELQSPEADPNSGDRDRQVESDEMLARQLQEELYNETLGIGSTEEIDADLAMALQQNGTRGAAFARHHQSRRRDLPNSLQHSRYRQETLRALSRSGAPTSSRIAQLRRELQMRFMDLNTSLDIMGTVAFGDGDVDARMFNILHSRRDFDENDYETLLQLDENNHRHGGASETQINNLPQSVIEKADSQEACAVCLEPPAAGDIIRHLPCLHKFHKDCIDAWLRRKRSCPICKCDIR